ncbi:hypothetical protein FPOA_13245 [Fusarium poae]|uniref:Xylanolytic transcriptional activator regulatory domain-containing protein n=1 Tax=Fusarium poae TaxID=36050 RepID=A0A1B8A6E9_FUSPO|nr:hypothetical protein FPOA_13245 [Fusarium poae]
MSYQHRDLPSHTVLHGQEHSRCSEETTGKRQFLHESQSTHGWKMLGANQGSLGMEGDIHSAVVCDVETTAPTLGNEPSGDVSNSPFSDRSPTVPLEHCQNALFFSLFEHSTKVYFQEWAPLFPMLHEPTFRKLLGNSISGPEIDYLCDELAQIYLVIDIAGLSSNVADPEQFPMVTQIWRDALSSSFPHKSIHALQSLTLATLCCIIRAERDGAIHYRNRAICLSNLLELHRDCAHDLNGPLSTLTLEMNKRVFWTLYTLDCFCAATFSLPTMLKTTDVTASYPSDIDDEYIIENEVSPRPHDPNTRMSRALALFKAARVLGELLDLTWTTFDLPQLRDQQTEPLQNKLDVWYAQLPYHLSLEAVVGKPLKYIICSHPYLMSIIFYYIKCQISLRTIRPGQRSKVNHIFGESRKSCGCIINLLKCFDELGFSFCFCLNKNSLLAFCNDV